MGSHRMTERLEPNHPEGVDRKARDSSAPSRGHKQQNQEPKIEDTGISLRLDPTSDSHGSEMGWADMVRVNHAQLIAGRPRGGHSRFLPVGLHVAHVAIASSGS